jgi:methylamine utilization protein MauE
MLHWSTLTLGVCAQLALAALFALAALNKTTDFRSFVDVIAKVGSKPVARPLAGAVLTGEGAAALGLMVVPGSNWPRFLIAGLAVAFAAAGLRARLAGKRIACHCFGGAGKSTLGLRQVALLPCWLALAAIATAWPPAWHWQPGLLGFAWLVTALAVRRLPAEWRAFKQVQGERLAVIEQPAPPEQEMTAG